MFRNFITKYFKECIQYSMEYKYFSNRLYDLPALYKYAKENNLKCSDIFGNDEQFIKIYINKDENLSKFMKIKEKEAIITDICFTCKGYDIYIYSDDEGKECRICRRKVL